MKYIYNLEKKKKKREIRLLINNAHSVLATGFLTLGTRTQQYNQQAAKILKTINTHISPKFLQISE
jgi:hypothetical protein